MSRFDDALSVSFYVMLLVGVPFVIRANSVIALADSGNTAPFYEFWNSGGILVLLGSTLFCCAMLIVGRLLD